MTNFEKKKQEALSRMVSMHVHARTVGAFQEGKITCSEMTESALIHRELTEEEMTKIRELEKKYGCLFYYAIKSHTGIGDMLALLYVSDHEEEWEMDRADTASNTPMAYVINCDDDYCSEFGSIGVVNVTGKLVRTE